MSGTGMTLDEAIATATEAPWAQLSPFHEAARVLWAEVARLRNELLDANAEIEATRDQLAELNEVLADAFPELERQIEQHPSHLRPVPPK